MERTMRTRLHSLREVLLALVPAERPDDTARRARLALVLFSALVLLLLAWSTWDHIRTRLERERALAAHVTAAAEERIAVHLRAARAGLADLVHQEVQLLDEVATGTAPPEIAESLWSILQLHLPAARGALLLDTVRGRLVTLGEPPSGPAGRSPTHAFLRELAGRRSEAMRLRSTADGTVVEVARVWYVDGRVTGAVAVILDCAAICSLFEQMAPEGHQLVLTPGPGLAATGTSTDAAAADGSLLGRAAVGDTGWVVDDRLAVGYVSELVHTRLTLGVALAGAFLLAALALYRWIRGRNRSTSRESRWLQESHLKLQAILAATTDGIILADARGRIELFNPAAEIMFGRLTEDVLNADVEKLIPDLFAFDSPTDLLAEDGGDAGLPVVRETRGQRKGSKDFPVRLWMSAVRFDQEPHLLIVVQDLTEHERSEQHLVFLEQRDVLTGLLNRKEFERRLAAILADEQQGSGRRSHALCHLDVDQFKIINDTCGHEAGDELLRQLAMLLKAKLTNTDLIARLGGDELGALFPDTTAEEARDICDGLIQTVRNFLFTWRDRSFDVAVSLGLVAFSAETDGPSSALSKADVACHMAKTHGRDRIHVYHEGDAELVRHHGDMRLVSAISQALSEGRFHLYAQPIVPIAERNSGHRHFEVLVRMLDETGKSVIPENFIPAAERYILMPAVDRWIINRLFSLQAENLRAWQQIAPGSFLFAVNLSGTSITDEGFLRYLKRQFHDWDIPHASVCFEITETAAMRNLERARVFMKELSALGCSFALDDFGTGLSSYGYLKELPVQYLKIDGSFVRGMAEDPVDYALVESINQIGHVLRLKTIAEWAEDASTLNQLRALNVDYAQGYGVGEAVPVAELTLADTAIPPSLEIPAHAQRFGPHRPRDGAPRAS